MSLPTISRAFGELFGKAKDALNQIQKKMASVLPSMPGQNVGKFYDLAIGVDIHATTWPPSPVCPVPHIGMVFDLMAVIVNAVAQQLPDPASAAADGSPAPFSLGDAACNLVKGMAPSVKVHGQWVANAGIPIVHLPGFILHIPFPIVAPFAESEMWMGSSTVLADGAPCSTQFHPALSCNSIGFPPPPRKKGIFKAPKKTLQAPTSLLSIITSSGNPVLVGGPPTIDLFQLMVKLGIKGLGKLWSKTKLSKTFSEWFSKTPLGKLQKKINCILFGEPVDAATGRVFHENMDFELPGPIPIRWSRTYYSDAEVEGSLGYNWHHSYNISIRDMDDYVILRLAEGREVALPTLEVGETYYHRPEKLFWSKDKYGYYYEDSSQYIYRFSSIKNKAQYNVLSKISTKDSFEVQFSYTSQGELFQILDSRKNKIYVKSDIEGRVTAVYIFEDNTETYLVRYKYDENGNMVETQDALDVSKYFVYRGHLLTKLTNQSGMSFYWEYEGEGDNAKCIHTWGDNGVLEYWTQYKDGFTKTRNSLGHETIYFYDENKLIYKIIDANGGITHQKYNLDGELEIVTNPEGYTTKRKYDNYGNVVQFMNENEESTHYQYDETNNLTYVRTPGGRSLSWKYDHLGRIVEKTTSVGDKLVYGYDGALLSSITNANGQTFNLEYNKSNDLERLTLPNGLYKQWQFDNRGRVTQLRDVKGNISYFEYNKVDTLTKMTLPDGNVHTFEYDQSQNLIHAQDNLHDVVFEYGSMGVLRSRTQNGRSVSFDYDRELQLRRIINEAGEQYNFELDGLGQVVKETGFDGLRREYIRDGVGRVTKVLRPDKRWTEFMYDGTGNVVHELQYDDTQTAYRYNSDGMLIEALNQEGHIQLKRDRNGRIIQELQGENTISRTYNKNGDCIHIGSSLGADIHQEYDEEGNLISLKSGEAWQADWQRDNIGLELYRQMTGGVNIRTERDRFGRESKKTIGVGGIENSKKQYLWGMGNRLQGIHNELTGTHINFDYDSFDNLVKADYTDFGKETESIYRAPDAIGNLYENPNRSDRKYDKGGRLLEDPNHYYHYDVEGNLCFKEFKKHHGFHSQGREALEKKLKIKFRGTATGWQYDWSANGMLKQVTNPEHGKIRFGYDPLGRRVYKETKKKRTNWLWDGNVPLHEWESHSTESLINVVTWIFEGGFVPCAKVTQDKSYSIVTDYLGTPTQMFDNEGSNIWDMELDIYGKVRTFKGSSPSDCPFRYQGQYLDQETGLYYNRFRYYDPEVGSYISKDPIGLAGGNPTLYSYVGNPNTWLDIFGLNAKPETAAEFEKRISTKPASERVLAVEGKVKKVANKNGWEKDSKLSKTNNRTVYKDTDSNLYAVDTQHGRIEYTDKRGNHLGEYDIDGKQTKPADNSGKHNLRTH